MKKILMVLMMIPLIGCHDSNEMQLSHKIEQDKYNYEFVDNLVTAIVDKDFFVLENHLSDKVGVHSKSKDESNWVSSEVILTFLDVLFEDLPLFDYDIDVLLGEGPTIYKLTCYIIIPDFDGKPKLGLALFAFSEENGKINVILIP